MGDLRYGCYGVHDTRLENERPDNSKGPWVLGVNGTATHSYGTVRHDQACVVARSTAAICHQESQPEVGGLRGEFPKS